MYTDDPFRDFAEHDARGREWLASRPLCDCCGEPIQEDLAYIFPKIGTWCERCVYERREYLD